MAWFVLLVSASGLIACSPPNARVATRLNGDAALNATLPFNPLESRVITSWIDRRDGTMSTLYGNEPAVEYATTHAGHDYPNGSVLSVVTWYQQEDPRWFGGNIPAIAKSVEFVVVKSKSYNYEQYSGLPLRKIADETGIKPNKRATYLLALRAAVMP